LGVDNSVWSQKLFSFVDTDNDGVVGHAQAFIVLTMLMSSTCEEQLESVFWMLDANGSGLISHHELQVLLRVLLRVGT